MARERAAKRQDVLRAAAKAFNENGFFQTSLDDIAERLKISKPSVYRLISSKDDVLFECKRIGIERIQNAAQGARESGGTGLDRLCKFLSFYIDHILDDFGRCMILVSDVALKPRTRNELRTAFRYLDGQVRLFVQEGVDDGSINASDAKLTAFFIFGAFNWVAHWYRPDCEYRPQEIADLFVQMIKQGISP